MKKLSKIKQIMESKEFRGKEGFRQLDTEHKSV